MKVAGKTAVFLNEEGKPLDFGVVPLDSSVYTILACEEVNMAVLVTDRQGSRNVIAIIWQARGDFSTGCEAIASASAKRISRQDMKLNSYAWSIAEKLDDGVRVKVTDAVDASEMDVCPECGMLNPKNSQYCLECGAEL